MKNIKKIIKKFSQFIFKFYVKFYYVKIVLKKKILYIKLIMNE